MHRGHSGGDAATLLSFQLPPGHCQQQLPEAGLGRSHHCLKACNGSLQSTRKHVNLSNEAKVNWAVDAGWGVAGWVAMCQLLLGTGAFHSCQPFPLWLLNLWLHGRGGWSIPVQGNQVERPQIGRNSIKCLTNDSSQVPPQTAGTCVVGQDQTLFTDTLLGCSLNATSPDPGLHCSVVS